ncbi:polysaccharide deacetylase family protein [Patescibacteria group bacterium]|nr:polysaccharide deacetylase family protein [Patescibacteria group bacterium]MCL5010065.1 polysaccharide deacetylase family protein [Patescibacteria group bacterium]
MKRKENKGKDLFKKNKTLIIPLIGIVSLFIAALILKNIISPKAASFSPETEKTEMRKLPPEIKKAIKKASPSAYFRVPILMYHYVEYVQDKKDTIRQALNINPNIFEAQIKTLLSAGYTFMTARQLGEVIDNKKTLPPKPILITFDDGHWDLDTVVLPILKKYHVKATAYIVPAFIGGSDFLTKSQLRNVIQSHLVDIGAHTMHHVALRNRSLKDARYEIGQSKKVLEKKYHIHVVSFAYPYGSFDKQTLRLVKKAGFTTAASTIPGIMQSKQNRFFLYRIRPGYRTGKALLNYLSQSSFSAY